ncbi:MAG: tRNA (adenosine(37)-N6)-dimethylallyltransferase MiaA [Ruminococcaceae bacterium]|nr:tRNA (adenosine(37)-N6)-dimethylallyltransferase MiaA [Oscillospiraceae bacterium]
MDNILCIVGPTASGKTRLSVALAQELDAEIVSFDSMQVYCGMDIGTAKPTIEERGGIHHHMFDVVQPWEEFSVSRYVEMADACVQDILSRGKKVILVGGTGLYIDSLILGREFAPFPATGRREELQKRLETEGIEPLFSELKRIDPQAAENIHPANHKRVLRALEVFLETGTTISEHNRQSKLQKPKYEPTWIGLDYVNREALYRRIDLRVETMIEQGLAEEVERLLASGISSDATSLQAIGYKELVAYLKGEGSLQEAKETIQRSSRRYAKRQRTWFYRNEKVNWLLLPDKPDFESIFRQARQICTKNDT